MKNCIHRETHLCNSQLVLKQGQRCDGNKIWQERTTLQSHSQQTTGCRVSRLGVEISNNQRQVRLAARSAQSSWHDCGPQLEQSCWSRDFRSDSQMFHGFSPHVAPCWNLRQISALGLSRRHLFAAWRASWVDGCLLEREIREARDAGGETLLCQGMLATRGR